MDTARLDEVLERALSTGSVTSRSDGGRHELFPIAIDPSEGEALCACVREEAPKRSIEVGLAYGISTLFILKGLLETTPTARHLAIDPNQVTGFGSAGLDLITDAGVRDHLEFVESPSEIALPRLLAEGRRFDFAFVDGNHRFDGVFLDLVYLGGLLEGGSSIFLDDLQLPSIRKAVRFCVSNLGWTIVREGVASPIHHWLVLRTPQSPLQRRFDYFVDF